MGVLVAAAPLALGLAHLAPLLALATLLRLGRYPGARALAGRGRVRWAPAGPARAASRPPAQSRAPVPGTLARGGLLIALGLAVRPPPSPGTVPPALPA